MNVLIFWEALRKYTKKKYFSVLFQAEARLAARRAARAEAREIRMRELERQQKEQEQNADRVFDMQQQSSAAVDPIARSRLTAVNSLRTGATSMNSRRSSEDSVEEEGRSLRDLRHELKVSDVFSRLLLPFWD